jgi:hypothetical protein
MIGVKTVAARGADPPKRIEYFEGAIADAVAAGSKPLPGTLGRSMEKRDAATQSPVTSAVREHLADGISFGKRPKGCASTEMYATERVGLLLGQYAKARPHEPAIYIAALAAILSEYPREVIEYVTDPRTGLANSQKWIPEPAEVRESLRSTDGTN